MKKPKSPCKDCENRKQFCHTDCDVWSVYERERNAYYDRPKDTGDRDANSFLIEQIQKRKKKCSQ